MCKVKVKVRLQVFQSKSLCKSCNSIECQNFKFLNMVMPYDWHVRCWYGLREVENAGEASLYLEKIHLCLDGSLYSNLLKNYDQKTTSFSSFELSF